MTGSFVRLAEDIAGAGNVFRDEPMSGHTTFRIGGPADLFVRPSGAGEIARLTAACDECGIPYFLLGNGSNLLVSDSGFRGVVIQLEQNYQECSMRGNEISAQAGLLLSKLSSYARDAGLTGLEYASGIPGTVGGAVLMNAGAYGDEISDSLVRATVLRGGETAEVRAEELDLGYRHSRAMDEGWIILSAVFSLKEGSREDIDARMRELRDARVSKQPLEFASAGSTFKRPEGFFAGKLIMDAGLAGRTVGAAQVSKKHCGFIINLGGATADDVRTLIEEVRRTVKENSGVDLEPEVRFLGFQEDR